MIPTLELLILNSASTKRDKFVQIHIFDLGCHNSFPLRLILAMEFVSLLEFAFTAFSEKIHTASNRVKKISIYLHLIHMTKAIPNSFHKKGAQIHFVKAKKFSLNYQNKHRRQSSEISLPSLHTRALSCPFS